MTWRRGGLRCGDARVHGQMIAVAVAVAAAAVAVGVEHAVTHTEKMEEYWAHEKKKRRRRRGT